MTQRPIVLLVDQNSSVLDFMTKLFQQAGFGVIAASCEDDACSAWQRNKDRIAAVIADYELGPDITGDQLCVQFASAKPGLKTFLLSAYPLDNPRLAHNREGIDFFAKPFDWAYFLAVIQQQVAADPTIEEAA